MARMRMWRIFLLWFFVLLANNLWKYCWSAQQAPSSKPSSQNISIVSPLDGTVVRPGEILHIDVSVPSGKPVRLMTIISPLGWSNEIRESPPWSFTLTIPKDDGVSGGASLLGKHPVYADLALVGQRETGASIIVDVERPDMPIKLWTQNSSILPETFGEKERIIVSGVFSDGTDLDLNESCCLSFTSSDENVAAVDSNGMVTAVGPGHAFITAMYRHGDQYVQLPIPVNFSPPAMNVEPRSLEFGEQQVGTPTVPLHLILSNTMHGPMKIYKPAIHGEFSETDDCDSLSPLREEGGTCTVNVVFTPPGKRTSARRVRSWE